MGEESDFFIAQNITDLKILKGDTYIHVIHEDHTTLFLGVEDPAHPALTRFAVLKQKMPEPDHPHRERDQDEESNQYDHDPQHNEEDSPKFVPIHNSKRYGSQNAHEKQQRFGPKIVQGN